MRLLPPALPLRQDPDRPAAPGGDRRRDRLLLPRQRPRLPRDPHHPAPPQDGRADSSSISPSTTRSSGSSRRSTSSAFARLARRHRAPAAGLRRPRAGSRRSRRSRPPNVADFCLEMYRRMGLLDGIRVARSSDPGLPPCGLRRRRLLRRCAVRGRDRAGAADRRRLQAAQGGRFRT